MITAKNESSSVVYNPIAVKGTDLSFEFRKTVSNNITTVSATPMRDSKPCGLVNYRKDEANLMISLKDVKPEDLKKLGTVLATIGEAVADIASESQD